MRLSPLGFLTIAFFFAFAPGLSRADEAGIKALTAGGHVAIVRHGLTTPGFGDPQEFRIEDCTSQRNLVEVGRDQSRALGRLLRERGVKIEKALSSEWCRCRETARLMEVGEIGILPALNNLYGRQERLEAQMRELRAVISAWKGPGTLLLVSHGSVVLPLTGIHPGEAQGVVLRPAPETPEGFKLVGRIGPDG